MPKATPRRGLGRPSRPLPARIAAPPAIIARVVLSSPPPAEWDYLTKREGERPDAEDADGAAV